MLFGPWPVCLQRLLLKFVQLCKNYSSHCDAPHAYIHAYSSYFTRTADTVKNPCCGCLQTIVHACHVTAVSYGHLFFRGRHRCTIAGNALFPGNYSAACIEPTTWEVFIESMLETTVSGRCRLNSSSSS